MTTTIKGIETRYVEMCDVYERESAQHGRDVTEMKQEVTSWTDKCALLEQQVCAHGQHGGMGHRITLTLVFVLHQLSALQSRTHVDSTQHQHVSDELTRMKQVLCDKEDTFARLSSSWERIQGEKDESMQQMTETCAQLTARVSVLQQQVTHRRVAHRMRACTWRFRMLHITSTCNMT